VDRIAVEEPLEIRIQGSPYAVLLRTPGDERELVAGFLASEGILGGAEDLAAISPCPVSAGGLGIGAHTGAQESADSGNYWNVALAEGVAFEQERRKSSTVGSTCGLCGVRTIDEIHGALPQPTHRIAELAPNFFERAEELVRQRQAVRDQTSGVHAAGLFHPTSCALLALAEDVGRHNAVDKVLGAQLLADQYPIEQDALLWVSGRLSFEIVQKAALAGIAVVVGLGVPTSLAVAAAKHAGISLFGVARAETVNRYSGDTEWSGAEASED
jgi:FdhD protein